MNKTETFTFKRRYPRRSFVSRVGVLIQGQYYIEKTRELGEKGMLFLTEIAMKVDDEVVVSFFIPTGHCIITRALVRYQSTKNSIASVGLEFTTVDFESRRSLRDYIAQRRDLVDEIKKAP